MKNHFYFLIGMSLCLWGLELRAQAPEYVPGKLYVKVFNRIVTGLPELEEVDLSTGDLPEVFPSFISLAQKYKFQQVRRAFHTRDINLDHTYMIEFDPRTPIEAIQNDLEKPSLY